MKEIFKIIIAINLLLFIACREETKPDASFGIEVPSRPGDNIFETGIYAGETVIFYTETNDSDYYVLYSGNAGSNIELVDKDILSDTIKENFQVALNLSFDSEKNRYSISLSYQNPGEFNPTLVATKINKDEIIRDEKSLTIKVKDNRVIFDNFQVVYYVLDDKNRNRMESAIGQYQDNIITISVPSYADLTNITPSFNSRNSKVYIGEELQESGINIIDFSEGSIKYKIQSFDDNIIKEYTVLIKYKGSSDNLITDFSSTDIDDVVINNEDRLINFSYIPGLNLANFSILAYVSNSSIATYNGSVVRNYNSKRPVSISNFDASKGITITAENGSVAEYTFIGTPQATHFELQGLSEVTNDRKVFTVDNTTTPVTYSMQLDPVYEIDGELLLTPIFEKNSFSKVYYMNGSDKVNIDSEEDQIDFNLVNKLYIENGSELDSVNVNITLY